MNLVQKLKLGVADEVHSSRWRTGTMGAAALVVGCGQEAKRLDIL